MRSAKHLALITTVALIALGLSSVPAEAGFSKEALKCRGTISKGGMKLGMTVAKTLGGCHKSRAKGKVAAATDCNDISAADSKGKVTKAEAKLRSGVGGAKNKCAGLSPAGLGYQGCPDPCGSIAVDDFGDVADCTICLVRSHGETMAEAALGSPAVPMDKGDAKCHGGVGKNQGKHFSTVLKERVKCQNGAEKKEGATTTDWCLTANPKQKISGSRSKAEAGIAKSCGSADLSNIDSCDDLSVGNLKSCSLDDADTRADTLFLALYSTSGSVVTTTTTTTTLPPADARCPDHGTITLHAGTGGSCNNDSDCAVGSCDAELSRCVTVTRLNTGMTGIAHGADVVNGVVTAGRIHCEGPFDENSATPCGTCTIIGLDPVTRNCRCANDNRQVCDEPFQADNDDCGGADCNCFLGPPLAFSAGNTPACVVSRFAQDTTGTVKPDLGEGIIEAHLRSTAYLGEGLTQPCPYCMGDVVIGDGLREGTCVAGSNDGETCDGMGMNESFPGPNGDAHSLDCFPAAGKNVSGAGLQIDLIQTTGTAELTAALECGFPYSMTTDKKCHCRQCTGDTTVPCTSDADCAEAGGTCSSLGSGTNKGPGECWDYDCVAQTDGDGNPTPFGVCATGPDSMFCDSMLRANGAGYIGCQTDADCSESIIGVAAGSCTVVTRRRCFLETVQASGSADPDKPIGAAVFCVPPTGNAGINGVAGLPGAGQIINQATSVAYCPSNSRYIAGVGCEEGTWTEVQALMGPSCVGCHSTAAPQGGLALDSPNGWSNLVGAPATCNTGGGSNVRVVPGYPGLSVLMEKLDNAAPSCGDAMPMGADQWSAADREVVRSWIAAGALNN